MKNTKLLIGVVLLTLFLFNCSDEKSPPKPKYTVIIHETTTGIVESKREKYFDNSKSNYRYNILLGRWERVFKSNTGFTYELHFVDGTKTVVDENQFYNSKKGDTIIYKTGKIRYE